MLVTLAQKSCVLVGACVDAYIVRLVPDSDGMARVELGSRSKVSGVVKAKNNK